MRNNLILAALCTAFLLGACGETGRENASAAKEPRQYDKNLLARGERVFQANCAVCHGPTGEGKPGWQKPGPDGLRLPPPLDDSGLAMRLTSAQTRDIIRRGSPPGQGNMPAWQGKLSEEEIAAVANYVTSLWSDQVFLDWHTKIEHPAR